MVSFFNYCNHFEYKKILVVLGLISMPFIAFLGSNLIPFYRGMASQIAKQVVTPYSMAFVTVPNDEVAKKIARGVVEKKLAACVNIIPKITSVYEWEGKINEDVELLLMMKTRTSVIADLTAFVRENHPYSVCEVIATSIEQGNQPYFDWIGSVVPEK